MNRAFLKNLPIILIIMLICSGCTQNNLIGENFLTEQSDSGAVKYKSGAILLKNSGQYDTSSRKNFDNPNIGAGEIKFGPRSINFGN